MEWLNYHHLHYFWLTVREGGVSAAARRMRLSPSTVSGQIRALEEAVGEPLQVRAGRGLVLTDLGRVVFRYADEIFSVGMELQDVLRGAPARRPIHLVVGVADVVPKRVARRLLEPATAMVDRVRLICREGEPERLIGDLAVGHLDLVLSDAPAGGEEHLGSHLLAESSIGFFAVPELARDLRDGFPTSLGSAPVLLPTANTTLRRALDLWFDEVGLRPRVVCECEDSALLQVFGEAGMGAFPAHEVVSGEIGRWYGVEPIGSVPIRERFYATVSRRREAHPALRAILGKQ